MDTMRWSSVSRFSSVASTFLYTLIIWERQPATGAMNGTVWTKPASFSTTSTASATLSTTESFVRVDFVPTVGGSLAEDVMAEGEIDDVSPPGLVASEARSNESVDAGWVAGVSTCV
ncbi:hypothetical protein C8J57DRAFT_1407513 [Mycena rebaudengoi]|nr:hypothetical protein C8J57DRAFT_1407513 [Mycena rebaudengoi]